MGQSLRTTFIAGMIVGGLMFGLSSLSWAAAEFVTVAKVFSNDDFGIIVRSNGDAYQIEKGVGCLSFWQYEGKQVLVSSPRLFLGVGSELVLPDDNQKCRIWDIKELGQLGGFVTDQQKPAMHNCSDGHWISSVSNNGKIVVLEDGSVWQIDDVDKIESMLWLPTENVLICGKRMVNSSSGKAVQAMRLK